mmetsp:Transcript_51438/g.55680  ORF Transcript_51438/g.55680 Transcript_51438/m.55680 type:complete len:178 (+) Transcript_51438:21-554(+)
MSGDDENNNSLSQCNYRYKTKYYCDIKNHTLPSIISASSLIYSFFHTNNYFRSTNTTNTSSCEGSSSSSSQQDHKEQQQQQQQQKYIIPVVLSNETNRQHENEDIIEPPCSVCKYTGMTVCTGLSLYFIKLATEETTIKTTTLAAAANKTPMKNHRPFFVTCSVGWAIAGVYRWYLG